MSVNPANDTAPRTKAARAAAPILVTEIRSKSWTRHGVVHPGEVVKGHQAEIVPGESIRLFGTMPAGLRNVKGPDGRWTLNEATPYERLFRVGDAAVYESFNVVFTGAIRSIAAKTITVVAYAGTTNERVHRLDLPTFDGFNWDFDAEAIARRNADWCD